MTRGQPPLELVMLLRSRTTFTSTELAFLFQLTGPFGATLTLAMVVFAGTPTGGPKAILTVLRFPMPSASWRHASLRPSGPAGRPHWSAGSAPSAADE